MLYLGTLEHQTELEIGAVEYDVKASAKDMSIDPAARVQKIIDRSLSGLALLVIVVLVVFATRIVQYGFSAILVAQVIGCFAVLSALAYGRGSLSDLQLVAITGAILTVAFFALIRFGLITPALMVMAVVPLVNGGLRGMQSALLSCALMTAAIGFAGFLHVTGQVELKVEIAAYMRDPVNWAIAAAIYVAVVSWGVVITTELMQHWRNSVRDLHEAQQTMMQERELVASLQRKESISQLSSGVAHDFNNILAVIMSNVELAQAAKSRPESATRVDAALDAALDAAERGSDLTRSLLSFAKEAVLVPKMLDINLVIEQSIRWIGRTIPDNIDIETHLTDKIRLVSLDHASLTSALLNLIINARDAMPKGGLICIKTRNIELTAGSEDPRLLTCEPGLYVELVVEDDGHGINPAEIDTIFEPFFSTKAPTEGSGLGLSMVQGFMKQSGGAAFVTSTPGSGARFSLLFQVSTSIDDQGSIQEFKRLPNTRRAPSGATLMVVDDEPEIVGSLKALLSTSGYTVRTASSGDAAWRSLSADANVDLVLSDVVMPGDLQGTDLACKIQQLKPNIPVILMSGHPLGKKENLRAPDIRYFLEKPVRKKTLINAIEDALDSRRNAVVDWRPD